MVIFHSYVSLPEGTHLTHSENISKHQQTWHLQVVANSIFTICAMSFNGQNLDYIYIYNYIYTCNWGMVINPSIGFNRKLYTHYGMDDHKPQKNHGNLTMALDHLFPAILRHKMRKSLQAPAQVMMKIPIETIFSFWMSYQTEMALFLHGFDALSCNKYPLPHSSHHGSHTASAKK